MALSTGAMAVEELESEVDAVEISESFLLSVWASVACTGSRRGGTVTGAGDGGVEAPLPVPFAFFPILLTPLVSDWRPSERKLEVRMVN